VVRIESEQDDGDVDVEVSAEPSLLNVWVAHDEAEQWLVDLPLVLDPPEKRTACDDEGKSEAGDRGSSGFTAPTQEHVDERGQGDGIGSQTRWLIPQIREWQALRDTVDFGHCLIRESHPEVCYARFAARDDVPSKQTDDGVAERLEILKAVDEDVGEQVRGAVERCRDATWQDRLQSGRIDDVLDAAGVALTAWGETRTKTIPADADPESDPVMVAPKG
jgi:predicted RNase H-like nuclease